MSDDIRIISVSVIEEVNAARRTVVETAREIGFDDEAVADLEVVVTELATNLAVHNTVKGEIVVREITDRIGKGIEIVARDQGPGIEDAQNAVSDHSSTGGTMGCGLGVVKRLTDEFDIYSHVPTPKWSPSYIPNEPCGTIVTVRKWMQTQSNRFAYSAYSRPYPGESANGDGYFVIEERDGLFLAVADGLGHGTEASVASDKAIEFIRENHWMGMERLLLKIHDVLHNTRGTALTMIRISLSERILYHTGVGNVEARIYPHTNARMMPRAGVLGTGQPPRPKINKIPWTASSYLIVFSDGISGRWDMEEIPGLRYQHVTTLSNLLIQKHARPNDDATVVVVKELPL